MPGDTPPVSTHLEKSSPCMGQNMPIRWWETFGWQIYQKLSLENWMAHRKHRKQLLSGRKSAMKTILQIFKFPFAEPIGQTDEPAK